MAKKSNWIYGLAIALGAIGWILVAVSHGTILGWYYLPAIALICAALLTPPTAKWWKRFTESDRSWVNSLLAFVVAGGILSGVLEGLNFINLPGSTPETIRCKVERIYRTEHHRTRRVGRHTITERQPYYRYHAEVRLPDNRHCVVPASLDLYRRSRHVDSLDVKLHRGLLGVKYLTR